MKQTTILLVAAACVAVAGAAAAAVVPPAAADYTGPVWDTRAFPTPYLEGGNMIRMPSWVHHTQHYPIVATIYIPHIPQYLLPEFERSTWSDVFETEITTMQHWPVYTSRVDIINNTEAMLKQPVNGTYPVGLVYPETVTGLEIGAHTLHVKSHLDVNLTLVSFTSDPGSPHWNGTLPAQGEVEMPIMVDGKAHWWAVESKDIHGVIYGER